MLFTAACRPSPDKNVLGSPKAEAGAGAGAGVDVAAACVSAIDGVAGEAAGGKTGAGGAEDSKIAVAADVDAAGVGLGCEERRLLSGHRGTWMADL